MTGTAEYGGEGESQPHQLLTVGLWTGDLTSLGLSFPTCQIEICHLRYRDQARDEGRGQPGIRNDVNYWPLILYQALRIHDLMSSLLDPGGGPSPHFTVEETDSEVVICPKPPSG